MIEMPQKGVPIWVWLLSTILTGACIVSLAVGWNASEHAKNAEQASISRDQAVEQHVNSMNDCDDCFRPWEMSDHHHCDSNPNIHREPSRESSLTKAPARMRPRTERLR